MPPKKSKFTPQESTSLEDLYKVKTNSFLTITKKMNEIYPGRNFTIKSLQSKVHRMGLPSKYKNEKDAKKTISRRFCIPNDVKEKGTDSGHLLMDNILKTYLVKYGVIDVDNHKHIRGDINQSSYFVTPMDKIFNRVKMLADEKRVFQVYFENHDVDELTQDQQDLIVLHYFILEELINEVDNERDILCDALGKMSNDIAKYLPGKIDQNDFLNTDKTYGEHIFHSMCNWEASFEEDGYYSDSDDSDSENSNEED